MSLPRYRCHKVVEAAKIVLVSTDLSGRPSLHFEDGQTLEVTHGYAARAPTGFGGGLPALVGGYYVRYPDGYESWSPAGPFESGYAPIEQRTLAQDAIVAIFHGETTEAAEALRAYVRDEIDRALKG
jgi:hypothetical protein